MLQKCAAAAMRLPLGNEKELIRIALEDGPLGCGPRAVETQALLLCAARPFPAVSSHTLASRYARMKEVEASKREEERDPAGLASHDPALLPRVWPLRVRRALAAAVICLRASAPGGSAQDTALGAVFRGGHEDVWRYMLTFMAARGDGRQVERSKDALR